MKGSSTTREKILQAAIDLLQESDGPEFSSREVARRSGVTIGTVHHHFGNKDALLSACIDTFYVRLEKLVKTGLEMMDTNGNWVDLVQVLVLFAFDEVRKKAPLARFLVGEVLQKGRLAHERREATEELLFSSIADRLSGPLGISPSQLRMRAKTLILAVGHYGVLDESSYRTFVEPRDRDGAVEIVRAHLCDLAVTLLLPPADSQAQA